MEFVFIELPKFKPENLSQKKLQVLWLRFLTEIDENSLGIADELMNQSEIRVAIDCLEESVFTRGELELYERYWDQVRVERTLVEGAELKGLEAGIEKGRLEGIKVGLEQGEKIARYKTAVYGFKRNMTDADVSELTGLSTEAVIRLRALFNKYGEDTESHIDEA